MFTTLKCWSAWIALLDQRCEDVFISQKCSEGRRSKRGRKRKKNNHHALALLAPITQTVGESLPGRKGENERDKWKVRLTQRRRDKVYLRWLTSWPSRRLRLPSSCSQSWAESRQRRALFVPRLLWNSFSVRNDLGPFGLSRLSQCFFSISAEYRRPSRLVLLPGTPIMNLFIFLFFNGKFLPFQCSLSELACQEALENERRLRSCGCPRGGEADIEEVGWVGGGGMGWGVLLS